MSWIVILVACIYIQYNAHARKNVGGESDLVRTWARTNPQIKKTSAEALEDNSLSVTRSPHDSCSPLRIFLSVVDRRGIEAWNGRHVVSVSSSECIIVRHGLVGLNTSLGRKISFEDIV